LAKGKGSKAAARRRLRELLAAHERGDGVCSDDPRLTVRALVGLYLDSRCRDLAPTTLSYFNWFIGKFIDEHGGLPVAKLTPAIVGRFFAGRPSWSMSTERCGKTYLLTFYRWAERSGLLRTNPLRGMRKPPAKSRGRECVITAEQHEKLVATAAQRAPGLREFLIALRERAPVPGRSRP
jgi:hypothetical protein